MLLNRKVIRNPHNFIEDKGHVIEKFQGYIKVRKFDTIIEAKVLGDYIEVTITTRRTTYRRVFENEFKKLLESIKRTEVYVDS